MRRPNLSYVEVLRAIEQLMASGRNPTIEAVREVIGRGSNSTILKYVSRWRVEQQAGNQGRASFGLADIPEELTRMLAELWRHAGKLAEERLDEHEECLQKKEAALEEDRKTLGIRMEGLEQQLMQFRTKEAELSKQMIEGREELARSKSEASNLADELKRTLRQLEETQAAAYQQHVETERALAELRRQLTAKELEASKQLTSFTAHLREEREKHEASEGRWIQIADQERQSNRELKQQLKMVSKELEQSRRQLAQKDKELSGVSEKLHLLQSQIPLLKQELKESKSEVLAWRRESARLLRQLEKQGNSTGSKPADRPQASQPRAKGRRKMS